MAVSLAPALAWADRPLVEGMSQRLTVACGSEGAKVQGTSNTVTLTGPCSTVLVEGSNNTVHIALAGRITVAGMNNKVYWSSGIDGVEPKITKEGIGNSVEHKTPADSPSGTATTKPSSGSGAGAGAGAGAGSGSGAGPTVSASSARGTATATTGGGTPSVTASGQRGTATATTAGGSPTVTASGQRGTATATTGGGTPSVEVSSGEKKVAMSTGGEAGPTVSAGSSGASSSRTRATATAPATATAGTGTPIVVANNQQVKTMDCEGRAVSVSGNGNRLTLKGACGPVVVGGNENILDVGSTTRIDTSGNRNVVKYRELVNDKAPVVTGGGSGNRVSKAEPL